MLNSKSMTDTESWEKQDATAQGEPVKREEEWPCTDAPERKKALPSERFRRNKLN